MLFASGKTHEARGSYWSGTVAVKGVRMACSKKSFRNFAEMCAEDGSRSKSPRDLIPLP
jgi:hypothetical protein